MFTATGLLRKEILILILIHHTTWTEVKSRWVTIHPQLLVTVVDSTACPPRSAFWSLRLDPVFLGVTATKIWMWRQQVRRQSFQFLSGGKKRKEKAWFILLWIIKYGALPNCEVGEESPRQETTTTQHSRKNLKMTQGQRRSYAGGASHTAVSGGGGFRGRTQRCGVYADAFDTCEQTAQPLEELWRRLRQATKSKMSRCFVAPWTAGEGRKFESRNRVNV